MYANNHNMLLPKQDNVKYLVNVTRLLAILSATTSAYRLSCQDGSRIMFFICTCEDTSSLAAAPLCLLMCWWTVFTVTMIHFQATPKIHEFGQDLEVESDWLVWKV